MATSFGLTGAWWAGLVVSATAMGAADTVLSLPTEEQNDKGSPARGGSSRVVSLDGVWWLALDPQNVGREQGWYAGPVPTAKETKVPWII